MSLPPQAARSDEALAPTRSAHRADPAPWMAGMTTFAGIMLIIAGPRRPSCRDHRLSVHADDCFFRRAT